MYSWWSGKGHPLFDGQSCWQSWCISCILFNSLTNLVPPVTLMMHNDKWWQIVGTQILVFQDINLCGTVGLISLKCKCFTYVKHKFYWPRNNSSFPTGNLRKLLGWQWQAITLHCISIAVAAFDGWWYLNGQMLYLMQIFDWENVVIASINMGNKNIWY